MPDASVLVPIFIEEQNSEACQEALIDNVDRLFLDFTLIEVSNALRSAVLRQRLSAVRATSAQADLMSMAGRPIQASQYLDQALILALSINHSVYDCLYAIAAHDKDATLLTCDRRFADKLDSALYRVRVV